MGYINKGRRKRIKGKGHIQGVMGVRKLTKKKEEATSLEGKCRRNFFSNRSIHAPPREMKGWRGSV